MPIGKLYLPVSKGSILPVETILGTMFVMTDGRHQKIPAGDFDVRLSEELVSLNLPIKFYDILPPKASSSVSRTGFGFIGPVPPVQMGFGLLFTYSRRSDRVPSLVYRSKEFSVYHAINTATLITIPRTVPQIEELLTAI